MDDSRAEKRPNFALHRLTHIEHRENGSLWEAEISVEDITEVLVLTVRELRSWNRFKARVFTKLNRFPKMPARVVRGQQALWEEMRNDTPREYRVPNPYLHGWDQGGEGMDR